jgi:hypothetical protein
MTRPTPRSRGLAVVRHALGLKLALEVGGPGDAVRELDQLRAALDAVLLDVVAADLKQHHLIEGREQPGPLEARRKGTP